MDDARAALYIYLKHRREWERWAAGGGARGGGSGHGSAAAAPKQQSLEALAAGAQHLADL